MEWELGRKGSEGMTFKEAQEYCKRKNKDLPKHRHWRLPTIWELCTLYQQKSVLGDDSDTEYFWSDTAVVGFDDLHWGIIFADGVVNFGRGSYAYRVRLVRVGRGTF